MKKSHAWPGAGLTAVALSSLLVACGGGEDGPQAVEIQFAAVAGEQPIACNSTGRLGRANVEATLKDLRFYISNAALLRDDGSAVPITLAGNDSWNLTVGQDRVTLIDLENASGACPSATGTAATQAVLKGTVPAGRYTGVRMTLGVPFALNHSLWSDPASAKPPLDIQAMSWSWQGGRKFAKIEVTQPAGASPAWSASTFNFHLGSTGCQGNPATGTQVSSCNAPNRMEFTLSAFDPATQRVAVDLRALLAKADITANAGGALGCMSGGTDPECQLLFDAIGVDWKADGSGTGLPVNGGAGQVLFRAIGK